MKKIGLLLAAIAVVSLSLFPVADSGAATTGGSLLDQARHGQVVMISMEQMNKLAKSHPALHAKLKDAYLTQTAPKLTDAERALLRQLSRANLREIKAGQAAATKPAAATNVTVTPDVWKSAGACVAAAAGFGAAVAGALPIAGIPVALIVTAVGVVGCTVYFFFPIIHDWATAK